MPYSTQVLGHSAAFNRVIDRARKVAPSNANVLITGESGTGKEVVAHYIHECSLRKDKPFVALNCAAIPETLLEAELFGSAKGAYTGAIQHRAGLIEEAEGGTLFLDEIADLNLALQAKILRVIQERTVKRVGENHYRPVDIRLIAATHENLNKAVREKTFREDLLFRINVISIEVPPLRERKDDILPLAHNFLQRFAAANSKKITGLTADAKNYLLHQLWTGNVRELENRIERAVVLSEGPLVDVVDLEMMEEHSPLFEAGEEEVYRQLFEHLRQKYHRTLSLDEITQLYIHHILQANQGAKDKTAKDLGIDRKTLYRKLNALREP